MVLAGLAMGSFLNVVIDRWPVGQSIVSPPSHCPYCKHRSAFIDNIPLFSYLWLRGRCRYCRRAIPSRLLLVEALTGALFGYVVFSRGITPESIVLLVYLCIMIVIFFIDLDHSLILNKVLYPSALGALALAPLALPGMDVGIDTAYINALAAGALGFGVFVLIFLGALLTIARGRVPMGAADLKMAALMGLMLGVNLLLVAFWFSFFLGGVVALTLVLFRRRQWRAQIPFGPYLATGTVIALFWGEALLERYRNLF